MRARDRDVPEGAGAQHCVDHGLVGIGDVLPVPPASLDQAVAAVAQAHGSKAARMLRRFAVIPDGALVWTRGRRGFFLGRLAGPWTYDDSPAAHAVGIHHTRPALWLSHSFTAHEVPTAVAATFGRGGRNFQRTHGEAVERQTEDLWREHREGDARRP
jgi:hypothetical protein